MFRPLLNITAELTAEDLEAALITPNSTLYDVHMPLLKVSLLVFFPSLSLFYRSWNVFLYLSLRVGVQEGSQKMLLCLQESHFVHFLFLLILLI